MIYKAEKKDASVIASLAIQMWENHTIEDLAEEFEHTIESEDGVIFLKQIDGQAVGFAQCQLRHDYVEGTESSPVGYLEGVFILPGYRKRGLAVELLNTCEKWAKERGCSEFASDCELVNEDSLNFHMKAGFTEANRIICFTKKL